MIKVLAALFLISHAYAYVPTVESLFRFGGNPDVSTNGLSLTMVVKKINQAEKANRTEGNESTLKEDRVEDYYKIFFSRSADSFKVAQTRYNNPSFSEESLEHKVYFSNFSPYTIKPSPEQAEKGLFHGLLRSLVFNDGAFLVNYLKSLGVPARLNNEIINREKVEFLANYKRYLVTVSKDRNARKSEFNPMRPSDPAAQSRVDNIMSGPMYVDTKQVKLAKDEGDIAWVVNAGAFEGVVSYKNREIKRIKYKSSAGVLEIICKDYWVANGTHFLPRFLLVKGFNGQAYQVELKNLRHYSERDDDLLRRLRNWDQLLKGKESREFRPEFLL